MCVKASTTGQCLQYTMNRRLGSRPMPPPPKQKHQPQEILGSTAARQRQRKQHRQQQQQQLKVAEADGVQGINTAAGAAEAARDRGQVAFDRGSVHSVDGAAGKGGSSDGSSSSNSSSRGGSGTRIEGNGEAGAAKRGARGSEMESPAEFHKLTEYAQLLLGCGELSIYTKTKEQLAREVVAAGSPPPGQQRPQVRGNDRDDDAEGRRLVEALLSGATPVSQEAEAAGVCLRSCEALHGRLCARPCHEGPCLCLPGPWCARSSWPERVPRAGTAGRGPIGVCGILLCPGWLPTCTPVHSLLSVGAGSCAGQGRTDAWQPPCTQI